MIIGKIIYLFPEIEWRSWKINCRKRKNEREGKSEASGGGKGEGKRKGE